MRPDDRAGPRTTAKPTKKPREHHVAALRNADQIEKTIRGYSANPKQSARKLRQLGLDAKQVKAVHVSKFGTARQQRVKKSEHSLLSPVRGTLEAVGLGGAAHPVRRLQHPGGRMEFPGFGKIPVLGARALKAELEANPTRQAFHRNIDETVADKPMARKMKATYDKQVLRASKRAGKRPDEFLKQHKQPEPAQKAMAGLSAGRVHAAQRAQKTAQHEERVRRVEKAHEALASGTGEEAFAAGKRELKGALPKSEFQGLRHLTQDEMDKLRSHVQHHPDLQYFEKNTAWDAVRNAHEHGQVPQPHELKILEKAFGPEFVAHAFAPSGLDRARHIAIEVANVPRSLMSSVDISAPGRQGLVGLMRHPIVSGRELRPMVRALKSEDNYRAWRRGIETHPRYDEALKDGLALTDVEHALANREEAFQSNYAEHIPVAGHLVRGSGRAYNRFLVGQRFAIYNHLKDYAESHGIPLDEKAGRQLADYINDATGRGHLGRFEQSAVGLNAIFFSPRLIASRLNFLRPDKYIGLDPFVRRQKMRAAFQTVAAVSTFLYLASRVAGVKVGADPRSSDFGKIRIGNTRIDIGGGFNQYLRLAAQLASGQVKDVNTGELNHGQGWDAFARFGRAKLAPTTSLLTDLATRTNYAGQPVDVKAEVASKVTPLVLQDAYSVLQDTHSIPAAVGAYAVGATGIGVQNYGPNNTEKPKTADDLRNALTQAVRQHYHHGLTPQIDRALKLRERREKFMEKVLPKRPGSGAPEEEKRSYALTHYRAQVDLMKKLRMISPAQARRAKKWAHGQDRHVLSSRTSELGQKYFGGDVLSSATKKLRDRGAHLWLGDY